MMRTREFSPQNKLNVNDNMLSVSVPTAYTQQKKGIEGGKMSFWKNATKNTNKLLIVKKKMFYNDLLGSSFSWPVAGIPFRM